MKGKFQTELVLTATFGGGRPCVKKGGTDRLLFESVAGVHVSAV